MSTFCRSVEQLLRIPILCQFRRPDVASDVISGLGVTRAQDHQDAKFGYCSSCSFVSVPKISDGHRSRRNPVERLPVENAMQRFAQNPTKLEAVTETGKFVFGCISNDCVHNAKIGERERERDSKIVPIETKPTIRLPNTCQ